MHTSLSSFNRNHTEICNTLRPERYRELCSLPKSLIARGQGASYGDAALNAGGHVVLTERLNRFISFDRKLGVITAESGVTLAEILSVILPSGWFLPVTPGTQYASLGGCVASDVHGKNHHKTGSFSAHILEFELFTAQGENILCSAKNNPEIFWATVGGMGLTGIISTVTLQLIPITNTQMEVRHQVAENIDETLEYLTHSEFDDDYHVAWIDLMRKNKNVGRSVIMAAHHLRETSTLSLPKQKQIAIPFNLPTPLLNNTSLTLFNDYYFKKQSKKSHFITNYQNYFYPLDKIKNWQRFYGRNGFIQYQCVLPLKTAQAGIRKLMTILQAAAYPASLAVLKRMGETSQGMLSFPMEGFTLALDLPIKNPRKLSTLLNCFDEIVINAAGRVYLAKDGRLTPEIFHAMYPRYSEWLTIKNKLDPNRHFNSSLARRLEI